MIPPDQAVAIKGLRQFLELHATCGSAALDMPDLPGRAGYRVVAACRCGDTVEYWLADALLQRQYLVSAVAAHQAA